MPTDRIAGTWYTYSSFTMDVNLTDGQAHQVSVYAVDWDARGRSERIDVLDTSGNVLDTQTISSFQNGQYLSWNLVGHVQIRVTPLTGDNAVLERIVTLSGQRQRGGLRCRKFCGAGYEHAGRLGWGVWGRWL